MNRHEIRSRVDGRLLHVVLRVKDFPRGRADISAPEEPLQLSVISTPSSTVYRAHKHIPKTAPSKHVTQETWIVVKGSVAVDYYDVNDHILTSEILEAGDCTITYAGGHGYQILTDETCVYEVKSGPYHGSSATDKVFIR